MPDLDIHNRLNGQGEKLPRSHFHPKAILPQHLHLGRIRKGMDEALGLTQIMLDWNSLLRNPQGKGLGTSELNLHG
jgi:hypothetical protein